MTLIICLDERGGYSLFGKRQSSDIEVLRKIVEYTKDKPLYITEYTEKLFVRNGIEVPNAVVVPDPQVPERESDGFAFVEVSDIVCSPEKIIAFCWNRHYPSDKKYEISPEQYELTGEESIVGKSHPELTIKTFKKRRNINEK